MANLYILVGVPGCGKSTYAKTKAGENDIIISSDAIREELTGDASNQSVNGKVFSLFHKRIREGLRSGKNVFADATNINMKSRRSVISCACKEDYVFALVFPIQRSECVYRDMNRERSVGSKVIDKMIAKFQMPVLEEGFDEICFEYEAKSSEQRKHTRSLDEYEEWVSRASKKIKQTSKWHKESLYEHITAARDITAELIGDKNNLFVRAAFLHDCGKIFTQSKDEKGYHFFNHPNVGAYHFLSWVRDNPSDVYEIAYLINYHDCSYQMPPKTLRRRFGEHSLWLNRFHKIDVAASKREKGAVEHYPWEGKNQ